MKAVFCRLMGASALGFSSLSFAGSPDIVVTWSPVASVPTLGTYGVYLLIGLVAVVALRLFKQKPSLLRGFTLLTGGALVSAGALHIEDVVSEPNLPEPIFSGQACESGQSSYPDQVANIAFVNQSQCPMQLSFVLTSAPNSQLCNLSTPALSDGDVVPPGESGELPYWVCSELN